MSWTHRVFEIYSLDKPLSELEGTPSDWVYNREVMWCDVDDDLIISFHPLWELLYWWARDRWRYKIFIPLSTEWWWWTKGRKKYLKGTRDANGERN